MAFLSKANPVAETSKNVTERSQSEKVLKHNKIGFCDKNNIDGYEIDESIVLNLLDSECKENNKRLMSYYNKNKIYQNGFEFYDNCVDSLSVGNTKVQTGKIDYNYSFTCTSNLRDSVIEKLSDVKNLAQTHEKINSNIFPDPQLQALDEQNNLEFNECSVENLKRISGKNFDYYKNSIEKIIKICETAKKKKLTLVSLLSLPPHDSVSVKFADLNTLKKEGIYVYVDIFTHNEYFNAEMAKYVHGTGMTSKAKYNCENFDEPFYYTEASNHKAIFDKSNLIVYSQDSLKQMAKYTKKIQTKAERIVSSNFFCRLGNQLNRTSTLIEYYADQNLLKSSNSDLNYSFWKEELKRMGYSEDGKSRISTIDRDYYEEKKTKNLEKKHGKQNRVESFSTTIEKTNDNASKYYKTLNKSLGDPQMQLAIMKLNQAQYYFLKAFGEKETALAAKNYAENLSTGNVLGKDDLQKILV